MNSRMRREMTEAKAARMSQRNWLSLMKIIRGRPRMRMTGIEKRLIIKIIG